VAELKTKPTSESVEAYLATIKPAEKRIDSLELLAMMRKITGEKGQMWGSAIVGFGMFHYKSERSSQEGDWPLVAFVPRKQYLTLYLMKGFGDEQSLLDKLGKHKTSVGCLYIKRLADVDREILIQLIARSHKFMQDTHLSK
jgi:hypothetical protein